MRASALRLMCRPYRAGLVAGAGVATAAGLMRRPWDASGGAAFGPAVLRAS
jgi:hypothetical protein